MKFVVLVVSSSREEWAETASHSYNQKIKHFVPFEILQIQSPKLDRGDAQAKVEKEGERILKALTPDDHLILLDERGLQMDSKKWAKQTNTILNRGKKRCCFLIGGAFGVSDSVRKRADETWSMSSMVFNHFVAQVVLLEQIYRSFTILKNLPYHNE